MCRRGCSNNCCAYVELVERHAGFCCHATGGFASELQPAVCADAICAPAGPAVRSLVRVYQPGAQSSEGFILGRQRIVGVRQTFGEGSFLLAQSWGVVRSAAQRGAIGVALRAGSERKSRLVSTLKNSFKNSFFSLNKMAWRTSECANDERRDNSSGSGFTGASA